jgi:hypothetical protein
MELKPCPFCGGNAYEESYDRLIQIGCRNAARRTENRLELILMHRAVKLP